MKRTESEEEHNNFKKAVKGRRIIPITSCILVCACEEEKNQFKGLSFYF